MDVRTLTAHTRYSSQVGIFNLLLSLLFCSVILVYYLDGRLKTVKKANTSSSANMEPHGTTS